MFSDGTSVPTLRRRSHKKSQLQESKGPPAQTNPRVIPTTSVVCRAPCHLSSVTAEGMLPQLYRNQIKNRRSYGSGDSNMAVGLPSKYILPSRRTKKRVMAAALSGVGSRRTVRVAGSKWKFASANLSCRRCVASSAVTPYTSRKRKIRVMMVCEVMGSRPAVGESYRTIGG